MLTQLIKKELHHSTYHPGLKQIMDYAVFPAGKLFRPRLVEAIALDLSHSFKQDHIHLGAAIEIHHAYTLVHDDLPAMDNDLIRRGKPSTHAAFGEWKAILAGDALLIYSFEELMKIKHSSIREIHHLFTWGTGARGLIQGQYLDLESQGKLNLGEIIRVHELKTARLIQIATLGTYLLSTDKVKLKEKVEFLRLGREIGVSFQLLDDLNELTASEVSHHEKEINPFIMNTDLALKALTKSHQSLINILENKKLSHTTKMLKDYFKKNQQDLIQGLPHLEENLNRDLSELKNWLTSFA
ncbi:MAG: polyprenyl synthetase family protein [Bacteriovoracaceae bacterium]